MYNFLIFHMILFHLAFSFVINIYMRVRDQHIFIYICWSLTLSHCWCIAFGSLFTVESISPCAQRATLMSTNHRRRSAMTASLSPEREMRMFVSHSTSLFMRRLPLENIYACRYYRCKLTHSQHNKNQPAAAGKG